MRPEFYREYFEVEGRHWWFLGRREIFLRILDRYLTAAPARRSRKILDVGCGTGTMIRELMRFGRAEGIDADAAAIDFCRRRGIEAVRQASSLSLPYDASSFDLVTALDVLEHLDDDRTMLEEIRRVLRPGGTFLLSVPAYPLLWGAQDEISHHRRRYVSREVKQRLTEAGFDIQRLSYFNTFLFPAIASVRLLRRIRPSSSELRSDFEMTQPGRFNAFLGRLFRLEAGLLERTDLPFGVSILALSRKPGGSPTPERRAASVSRPRHKAPPRSPLFCAGRSGADWRKKVYSDFVT
jgi:SAM-dependent methyltransferase